MKIAIMAGGTGTRFWPRSVEAKPKQFLALTSEETMIQQTYRRFCKWLPKEDVYVITTNRYLPLLTEQIPELDRSQIIVEPDQRDTGPCIALVALHFLTKGIDEVLVTAPSDQFIPDEYELKLALLQAAAAAETKNTIVTLGIVPTRPETGYGYIETKETPVYENVYLVKAFIEKPTQERAEKLIQNKHVFWNSGIFVWKPSTIAHYMNKHQSHMWGSIKENMDDLENVYPHIQKISIDFAILEHAEKIYTIPVDFIWDDIGTWTSLERVFSPDKDGNFRQGDTYVIDSSSNIIITETQKTIVIGVDNLIIVSTKDGILICHKREEQKIKNALQI